MYPEEYIKYLTQPVSEYRMVDLDAEIEEELRKGEEQMIEEINEKVDEMTDKQLISFIKENFGSYVYEFVTERLNKLEFIEIRKIHEKYC